jgi:hypothetical protein
MPYRIFEQDQIGRPYKILTYRIRSCRIVTDRIPIKSPVQISYKKSCSIFFVGSYKKSSLGHPLTSCRYAYRSASVYTSTAAMLTAITLCVVLP